MKIEFMAENFEDTINPMLAWMRSGIIPETPWEVRPNAERPGYWIAESREDLPRI